VGDLLYADTTTTLAKLADVAVGNALISGGVNSAFSWGKIGLSTHVSGTLPVGNGGTGATTLAGASIATYAGAETLSNKNIQQRVVDTATATAITINADTTDLATMANTQGAGTFTINAPSGTPFNGQKLMFRMSSTAVQTFSWNAIFQGSADQALPTASSGAGKYDYMGFFYNSINSKWQLVSKNFGF
jgi:hypothetical protein